jgi:hypothetical protein
MTSNGAINPLTTLLAISAPAATPVTSGHQQQELVAAQAGDGVGGAQQRGQAFADELEQRVARAVAQRVVDVLEVVEIEVQHRHAAFAAARGGRRLLEAVAREPALGQAGQRVVRGHDLHAQLRRRHLRVMGVAGVECGVQVAGHQPGDHAGHEERRHPVDDGVEQQWRQPVHVPEHGPCSSAR